MTVRIHTRMAARAARIARRLETLFTGRLASAAGFSLIESLAALSICTAGLLGLAAVMTTALSTVTTSAADQLAKDKAYETLENIVSARESKLITWAQLNNVNNGGIFTVGPNKITTPGADRIIGTLDDDKTSETLVQPGPDGALGTGDDVTINFDNYTREIQITNVSPAGAPDTLRQIKVIIVYSSAGKSRTISLTTLVSSYS